MLAQRHQIGIKETGSSCTVPNNNKAKLMYYLNCVASVLELDNPNLYRLKNYQNYQNLDQEDTDALLLIVTMLSPDELIGKVIIILIK